MTLPRYRIELVSSADMIGIVDLKSAVGRRFNPVYNKPGSLSVQLPISSYEAQYAALWSTAAVVYRNGVAIWSGPCTNIVDSAAAGTTDLTFVGWMSELDRRYVRQSEVASLIFSGVVGGSIVSTLLSTVNAQQDSTATVRPTHLSMGSFTDTQVRTRSYKAGDNYGQIIRELIEIENGLDVFVDPLTRKVSTRAPTAYADNVKAKFGFGAEPGNLRDVVATADGASIANRETVMTSTGATYSVDDPAAITAASVMLEKVTSLSDVGDPVIAQAYAAAELEYERYGVVTYALSPKAYGEMPRPWDDFELGDKIYFSANRGRLKVTEQAVRVFSMTIAIDDNGNEIISELGVSPS